MIQDGIPNYYQFADCLECLIKIPAEWLIIIKEINHQSALAINISEPICIYLIIYATAGRRDLCWIVLIKGDKPEASINGMLDSVREGY